MDNRDAGLLSTAAVLESISRAVANAQRFSLVRCGDGENLCMAQETVLPLREVMQERWAKSRSKGVRLPDLRLRDRLVTAVKSASLVGVHRWDDTMIQTSDRLKRPLLEKVFAHYNIKPRALCDATVTRFFPQLPAFWEILKSRRVLLVSKWAEQFAAVVRKPPYNLTVAGCVGCGSFAAVDGAIKQAVALRREFDIALVSAGVNALIVAAEIARRVKKPAIDFGKGMQFMVDGRAGLSAPEGRYAPR